MAINRAKHLVMLDANILIAGNVWPRWSYEVLQHAIKGDYRLVLCDYVIKQARRQFHHRFPDHLETFERILEATKYKLVEDPSREQLSSYKDLVRDHTDLPLALAAINAEADYLVSEDKDLTAQDASTVQLRQKITVMISGTFLREVMGWRSEDLEEIRNRTWRDLVIPGKE